MGVVEQHRTSGSMAHRGTVLEFGDRRLALSFEMDGADASLIVKHAKFPSRFETGVCVWLGKNRRERTRCCHDDQRLDIRSFRNAEHRNDLLNVDLVSALTVATAGTTNTETTTQTEASTHSTEPSYFWDSEPPSLRAAGTSCAFKEHREGLERPARPTVDVHVKKCGKPRRAAGAC